MTRLLLLFLLMQFVPFAMADVPQTQFGKLMENAAPRDADEMFDIAWNSGAIKPESRNQAYEAMKNTYASPQNNNLSPRQMYYEVEKSLVKSKVLTYSSPAAKDVLTQNEKPKITIETSSSVTTFVNPAAITAYSPEQAISQLPGSSDSYKIYSAIKPFLSKDGKKDNNRREIIQIINENKKGSESKSITNEQVQGITKTLKEKGYLN